MQTYTARPTDDLRAWLHGSCTRIPGLEQAWKAALSRLEANPHLGTPLGPDGRFLGLKFPSDADRKENSAFKMLPQIIVAYRINGTDLAVVEVKLRAGAV